MGEPIKEACNRCKILYDPEAEGDQSYCEACLDFFQILKMDAFLGKERGANANTML